MLALNMTRAEFLNRVEAFLAKHNMRHTVFGKEAARDPAFVQKLREGRSPTLKKFEQVVSYMEMIESSDPAIAAE